MESKCFRKRCNFVQEVAHMDEALDTLQQHYRAIHPTKGFYRNHAIEDLETWNLTVDEIMENNNMGGDENPQYDWRALRAVVSRGRGERQGYVTHINAATIEELGRRVDEHYAQNPEPALAEPGVPGVRLAGVREFVQYAGDGIVAADAAAPMPPFPAAEDEFVVEEGPEGF